MNSGVRRSARQTSLTSTPRGVRGAGSTPRTERLTTCSMEGRNMLNSLSLVMTINNRSAEVCKAVADSFKLPGNGVDEVVIVLDRPSQEVEAGVRAAWDGCPVPLIFERL